MLNSDSTIDAVLVGALVAGVGYVGKLTVDSYLGLRQRKAERLARLLKLSSLVNATSVAFQIQAKHRDHLADMLRENHPNCRDSGRGYDALFRSLYRQMTPEELELHSIIRGITMHALRPINEEISRWLADDIDFRTSRHASGKRRHVAEKLNVLAAHLLLWQAKYETWIPSYPEHALVYMADEQDHGLGFPTELEEAVRDALEEYA